ncbi:MAG: hypothetical protein RLY20_3375 [Verrucomicrobiota bacterium]|jgi:hypothetical protein
MKRHQIMKTALIAAGLFAGLATNAQELPATNRLTFSARFGLNISAKFSGVSPIAVPTATRTTPDGATYNYDDGYVLPDVSGSGDGNTWNWGYDNSASQVNSGNNTILLSRSSGLATLRAPAMDDEPSLGCELAYTHELGVKGKFRYGVEGALNYLNIGMSAHNPYSLRAPRITDAFAYFTGTTPPGATTGSAYQGTFDGPGFVIGTTPVSSTTSEGVVGTVTGTRSLDATLWGGRVGPYFEYYFNKDLSISLSGGLAVGLLDTSVAWDETISFTGGGSINDTGHGGDTDLLCGGYLAGNLFWRFDDHWSAAASVQYQNLGTYSHAFGSRKAELDLGGTIFFSIGVSYDF